MVECTFGENSNMNIAKIKYVPDKIMKRIFINRAFILIFLLLLSNLLLFSQKTYNFSYFIQGNAKGKVFLIIPFRIFYQLSSTMDFISKKSGDKIEFQSIDSSGSGYMLRTLGFSGRSLALLIAGLDIKKMSNFARKMMSNFKYIAPGFSKHIISKYINYFLVKPSSSHSISFKRSTNGIHHEILNSLKMKRVKNSSKVLNISFNVFKILAEVLNVFNHSFLPKHADIGDLIKNKNKEWKSPKINFTSSLKHSSEKAAKIFTKIKGLVQKKPFRISYKISDYNEKFITIKGTAFPKIPIWHELLIKNFERVIKLEKNNSTLISDRIKVVVSDNYGRGGYFISYLKLKNM